MNSSNISWFKTNISKFIDWWTRPTNVGFRVATFGLAVFVLPGSINWALGLGVHTDNASLLVFANSAQLPGWLDSLCRVIGALLFFGGLALALFFHYKEKRLEGRQTIIAVEFKGLTDISVSPLKRFAIGPKLAQRQEIIVDVAEHVRRNTKDEILTATNKIKNLESRISDQLQGRDRQDLSLVVGGLMPVPLLFLGGYVIDDNTTSTLMDWERNEKKWLTLSMDDDGKRFLSSNNQVSEKEVVLAISASYLVDYDQISNKFKNLPIIKLELVDPLPNKLWSEEKQNALAKQFLDVVVQLANSGVRTIHMILASPSSLAIRLGSLYDSRNAPNLVVYQYEKDKADPYPWGVMIKANSNKQFEVV